MKISWFDYRQGMYVSLLTIIISIIAASVAIWEKIDDASFLVAVSLGMIIFIFLTNTLFYYVILGPNRTLIIKNIIHSYSLSANDFNKVEAIRGFSFQILSTNGKIFKFAANPLDRYTSNLFPEYNWASEITKNIKTHLL